MFLCIFQIIAMLWLARLHNVENSEILFKKFDTKIGLELFENISISFLDT